VKPVTALNPPKSVYKFTTYLMNKLGLQSHRDRTSSQKKKEKRKEKRIKKKETRPILDHTCHTKPSVKSSLKQDKD
jgi:hypothetical protein